MLKFILLFCIVITSFAVDKESYKDSTTNVSAFPNGSVFNSYRRQIQEAKEASPTKGVYKIEEIPSLTESQCESQGFKMYAGTTISSVYKGCYKYSF
jgi:hypothetical protein